MFIGAGPKAEIAPADTDEAAPVGTRREEAVALLDPIPTVDPTPATVATDGAPVVGLETVMLVRGMAHHSAEVQPQPRQRSALPPIGQITRGAEHGYRLNSDRYVDPH